MNKTKNKIEFLLIQNYILVHQIKFNKLKNNLEQEIRNSKHKMIKTETINNKNL